MPPSVEVPLQQLAPPPQQAPPQTAVVPVAQQDPLVQFGALLLQTFPQAPQLAALVKVLIQAPLQTVPVQHTPDWQVSPLGQTVPQAPQLAASLCRFEQTVGSEVGQPTSPLGQLHTPLVQTPPLGHARLHTPQLSTSLCRSTQAVGAATGQASGLGARQLHVPPWHCSLVSVQAALQEPQLA